MIFLLHITDKLLYQFYNFTQTNSNPNT